MRITTKIKLKPHLIEWLRTINGDENGIVASKKNIIGHYIFPQLTLPPDDWQEILESNGANCEVQLMKVEDKNVRYNWFIHPRHWYYIQQRLDIMFEKLFLEYMTDRLKMSNETAAIHSTIYDFMEEYNLTADRFDMLKQRYYRSRRNMQQNKKKLVRNSANLLRICHGTQQNRVNLM